MTAAVDTCPAPECGCRTCGFAWRSSVHEAGHVVGALAYGFTFNYAHAGATNDGMEGAVLGIDNGDDKGAHMVISLMGPQAEILVFGGQLGGGDAESGDYAEAFDDAGGDEDVLDEAEDIADELLDEWADVLDDIARALFEAGELTYDEAVEYA
jgi:hypothetical protein